MAVTDTHSHAAGRTRPANRVARADDTLLRSGLVDRQPATLQAGARLHDAIDLLLERRLWGVPVVDGADYVGTVTAASLVGRCLPVAPESLAPGAGLGWLPADLPALRRALGESAHRAVEEGIDISVPTVRVSVSPAHLLLLLARRAPAVPVLDDAGRQLLGVATAEGTLRALRAA